jgi:biotin transport system substrate-specific component
MHCARSASFGSRSTAIRLALAATGSVLLAVSANVAVPMLPVPITLQTLALPLLVLALGRNLAVTATVLYLAEGALGLPVFAPVPDGIPALFGPVAGYLWTYPVAALVMGTLLDRGANASWAGRWASIFAGDLVIFAAGAAWLGYVLHLSMAQTLALGVTPFIVGDLLKITIASALPSQSAAIAARFRL